MGKRIIPVILVLAAICAFATWLGVATPGRAVQPGQAPFRNPVEQREQMILELQEIKELLKQQNEILRRMQNA